MEILNLMFSFFVAVFMGGDRFAEKLCVSENCESVDFLLSVKIKYVFL